MAKEGSCDQCRQAASWKITIKDKRGDAVFKVRAVKLCGNHAQPLRARRKTTAYEVTRITRIVQKGFYTK